MIKNQKIACVIPARLNSTRFPQKVLSRLLDKPLLQWVWEAAQKAQCFDEITFAIDSDKTAQLIKSFNGSFIMTSKSCASGTDRLIEIVKEKKLEADIWVNWQGDEPFISPKMILTLLQSCSNDNAEIWTLKKKITQKSEITSANFAKVVCDSNSYALYFSRSPIPFYRDLSSCESIYYKHIGIYAFTTQALKKLSNLPPSSLENAEKLEQLRFLQNNMLIKIHETDQEVIAIDHPEDLTAAECFAKTLLEQNSI